MFGIGKAGRLAWLRVHDLRHEADEPFPGGWSDSPGASGAWRLVEPGIGRAPMLELDDLLGNPLENVELVGHHETSFVLIMKDGTIYKNSLK
jgi:hypothetical protein